jgi:acetoin:2,6-dichlorophenolindophenol oxidoreductase subunit beta
MTVATKDPKALRVNEALREALFEEMEHDDTVMVFGEDVGVYGGMYRVTDGLLDRFGPDRVRDTPISEAGIVGMAVGLAQAGMRPIVEIMYMDFIGVAMDPIVNQMGTTPYILGEDLPMVLRLQGGTGGSSPHHGKTLEAWFCHVPDIVVIMPSTAADHKALLKAAIRDPRPVIFCESRHIYGELGPVMAEDVIGEIGKAAIQKPGEDITIVAWGRMVYRALEAAKALEGKISVEVIDLRTLVPLDMATLQESVERTGRCLVVHEAWQRMGYGAEVVARIAEACFEHLEAPVSRFGAVNRPQPFAPVYLDHLIPTSATIAERIIKLVQQ